MLLDVRSSFANTLVSTFSNRALSEGLVRITGYSSSAVARKGGDSRVPPASSTYAMPVKPWVFNTATVSSLIGVPRSMANTSRTRSGFAASS